MPRPRHRRFDPASVLGGSGSGSGSAQLSRVAACAYAILAIVAAAIATLREASLFTTTTPWLSLSPPARAIASVAGGLVVAAATIRLTPVASRMSARVRALQADLRPTVRDASGASLLFMAIASGTSEELFFRGALVPWVGVVASSVTFGLLHQVRGPARWVWVSWAGAMGLVLAALFQATGYLAGCVVAHVAVNAANLRYVRDHEPSPAGRELGGLLRK